MYYLRFEHTKNLKLSRRGYCIGKFVFSNHMETSGEKANSDHFVHFEVLIPLSLKKYRDRPKIIC